jgi:acetyl-CoA carboxylase carboxyl transferase subunit alpha
MTAEDLYKLGVIDEVIPEPAGGAHRDPDTAAKRIAKSFTTHLSHLMDLTPEQLLATRDEKYRKMGVVLELTVQKI